MICSTIAPHDVESCAARLAALHVACIDAPMSGGPARARDGTMSLMVACADAVFVRHEAVLRDLSSQLVRLGERIGDGARTKLVNNLLAGINLAAAAEALALAERLGLDPRRTLGVFEQSSAQSWIGSDRLARALADDFAPRAHTSLLAKDTTLAVAMVTSSIASARVPRPVPPASTVSCPSAIRKRPRVPPTANSMSVRAGARRYSRAPRA